MTWIIDTHVHVYPGYDLGRFCAALVRNLRQCGAGEYAACLTERSDCRFYRDLAEGRVRLPAPWRADPGPAYLLLHRPGDPPCRLVPGFQVATANRLEILALGLERRFEDGGTLADAWRRIVEAGGLPVVPWSPGKWIASRGREVRALAEQAPAGTLGLGDSLMRPARWPRHPLLGWAARRGLPILPGSDPLPLAGEEGLAGRLAVAVDGVGDVASALGRLRVPGDGGARPVGIRLPARQVARRWWALRRAK